MSSTIQSLPGASLAANLVVPSPVAPQGYIQTYGTTWLRPTSVMDARFARVSGQIDF